MIERSRGGPDGSKRSHVMAYAGKAGATEAAALFGPPRAIIAGLHALQAVGVRYVLISGGEARQSMQRFAAEVMPASEAACVPNGRSRARSPRGGARRTSSARARRR
jgi:hypothetical protein